MDWAPQKKLPDDATAVQEVDQMRLTPFHFNYLHPEDRARLVNRRRFLAEQSQGQVRRHLKKLVGEPIQIDWERSLDGISPAQYWRNQQRYKHDWYTKDFQTQIHKQGEVGFIPGIKREKPQLTLQQKDAVSIADGLRGSRYRKTSPQTRYIKLPPTYHQKIIDRPVYIQVPQFITIPSKPQHIYIHSDKPQATQVQIQTDPFQPQVVVKTVEKIVNKYIDRIKQVEVIKHVPITIQVEKIVKQIRHIVQYVDKNQKLQLHIDKQRQLRRVLRQQMDAIKLKQKELTQQKEKLSVAEKAKQKEIQIQTMVANDKIESLQSMNATVKELQTYLQSLPEPLKKNIVQDMRFWRVSANLQQTIKYHPGARQVRKALDAYQKRLYQKVRKKELQANNKLEQTNKAIHDAEAKVNQAKEQGQRFQRMLQAATMQTAVTSQDNGQPELKGQQFQWGDIGGAKIMVSVFPNHCWIGTRIQKDGHRYFTHQSVKLMKKWWPLVNQAWKMIEKRNLQPMQKVIVQIGKSDVCLIKDRYKGTTFIGMRHFNYYDSDIQPTRRGFNLRIQEFAKGMTQWNKIGMK